MNSGLDNKGSNPNPLWNNSVYSSYMSMPYSLFNRCLVLLLLLGFTSLVNAQEIRTLHMRLTDSDLIAYKKTLKYKPAKLDSLEIQDTLLSWVGKFNRDGFLLAGVDSVTCSGTACLAFWYLGPKFRVEAIKTNEIPNAVLNKYARQFKRGSVYHPEDVAIVSDALVNYYMNSGFPFVKMSITPRINQNPTVDIHIKVDKGTYIRFDSVLLVGNLKLNQLYLQNYLGIRNGGPFSQKELNTIPARLQRLPYAREIGNPGLKIEENKAKVSIPAKAQRISQFDFLLGILPNQEGKKVQLNGQMDAQLWNVFGMGEQIKGSFYRTKPLTQEIRLQTAVPYIWKTPIGMSGALHIFKRDTTSLELQTELGLQYTFNGENYIRGFWTRQSANLVSISQDYIQAIRNLPSILDYRQNLLGIELKWQNLDRFFNPRRGGSYWLKCGIGMKTILENQQILALSNDKVDFKAKYDKLNNPSSGIKLEGNLQQFFPIRSFGTFLLQVQGGWVRNSSSLLTNELYRIGGYNQLRGFNDQSILASSYEITTAEARFTIQGNSYLNFFIDEAIVINELNNSIYGFSYLFSFGTGIHLETKAGLLHLVFALGKEFEEPISFRDAKIHIGYSSLF